MSRREWAWVVVAVLCAVGWFARPLSYETLASVLIGAAISGAISWYIYERSSVELKDEAEKLRKLHNATLNALPIITDGKYKVIRDEQGNFKKAEYHMRPDESIAVSDSVQTKLE